VPDAFARLRRAGAPAFRSGARSERRERLFACPDERHLARMLPVLEHWIRDGRELPALGDAEPEVVVLGFGEPVASGLLECLAPERRRRMGEDVVAREPGTERGVLSRRPEGRESPPRLVDRNIGAAHEPDVRVRVEERYLPFQALGQGYVVGIESRHVGGRGDRATRVQRSYHAIALTPEHADSGIARRPGRQDLRRPIRRAIVDDDQLELAQRLREDALERLLEKCSAVPYGEHYAHPGHWCGCHSRRRHECARYVRDASLGRASMVAQRQHVIQPGAPARRRAVTSLKHWLRILHVIAGAEFKLKYADSALGYVWSIAKPMALFSVLYVVFGRFMGLGKSNVHYPIYLLIGIILWTFFVDASSMTLTSLVSRGSLLRKLMFPRLILPISVALTAGITLMVNMIPLVVLIAWNRLIPQVQWLLLIPLFLELFIFTLGVSVILATLFVRFRDVGQLWELTTQLLFYASPIIIPVGFLPPWSQPIAFLSPFVQIMQDMRAVLVPNADVITATSRLSEVGGRLTPIGIAVATLAVGLYLFQRESPWFAERV